MHYFCSIIGVLREFLWSSSVLLDCFGIKVAISVTGQRMLTLPIVDLKTLVLLFKTSNLVVLQFEHVVFIPFF
jgi:hypothetical protein